MNSIRQSPSAPPPLATSGSDSPFMERMVQFLLPYFTDIDPDLARKEILETLASYGARTRSEMLNAARIIAFGLAALDTLREATASDLSASLRLRYRGCANGLNRSCQLSEKSLAGQLAGDPPIPTADPADDITDAETEAVIRQAQADIYARVAHHATRRPGPQPTSTPAGHNSGWSGALMDALAAMGTPVQPVPAASTAPG